MGQQRNPRMEITRRQIGCAWYISNGFEQWPKPEESSISVPGCGVCISGDGLSDVRYYNVLVVPFSSGKS